MSQVYLHGFGEGSGLLNYSVTAASSEEALPAAPEENTIVIFTDAEITGWQLSAGEPQTPEEGLVWICTGVSSPVAFAVAEENPIWVCPLNARQYTGGAWAKRTAKSYIGGSWVDWLTYLYSPGNECADITGGWTGMAVGIGNNENETRNAPMLSSAAQGLTITHEDGFFSGMAVTANTIDLTEYSTLTFRGTVHRESGGTQWCVFGVWTEIAAGDYLTNLAGFVDLSSADLTREWTLDLSKLSGGHYVGFGIVSTTGSGDFITVEQMYLER